MARLVGGRFRLVRPIGRGGMGEVHLARLEAMPGVHKLAAVKLVRAGAVTPAEQSALLHEARVTARFSHPHAVQLLDAGVDDGAPWIALEYVAGVSLRDVTAAMGGAPGPPWMMARLLADVCAGLHAVHEAKDEHGRALEVVHRDVSPQNVLVSWDGVVKIADFGVARSTLQSSATSAGTIKGKLAYMAPEQARGAQVDRRADVFAMGVLLWESLTAQRLFLGENEAETLARVLVCDVPSIAAVAPAVAPSLEAIAKRALQYEPGARFASAREMQEALESAMREAGVEIGGREIAALLAHLLPDRVREHERWLREAPDDGDAGSVTAAAAAVGRDVDTTQVMPRRSRRGWALGLAAVVAIVAAFGLGARTSRSGGASGPAIAAPPAPSALAPPASSAAPVPSVAASVVAVAPEPSTAPPPATAAVPSHRRAAGSGVIDVGSRPVWSRVRIDGKSVGDTPIMGLRVAAGSHSVEAIPQGTGAPLKRAVVVAPDGHARVVFDVP